MVSHPSNPVLFLNFPLLPLETRRLILIYFFTSSSDLGLWLNEPTHHISTHMKGRKAPIIKGCPQLYRWSLNWRLQLTALEHWNAVPPFTRPERVAADETGYGTFLAARHVNREFDAAFMDEIALHIKVDENFVSLLTRISPWPNKQAGSSNKTKAPSARALQIQATDNAFRIWLSRFRSINFFTHESNLPHLDMLRKAIMNESANPQARPDQRQRKFHFTIWAFNEHSTPPRKIEDLHATPVGDGRLPNALSQAVNRAGMNLVHSAQQIREPSLWVQSRRGPPAPVAGGDRVFYNISWKAESEIPNCVVDGVYIGWTRPGVMRELCGWEPDPFEENRTST